MLLPSSPFSSSRAHGQISKSRELRPRNVPERDDRAEREAFADQLRREGEVIILHQDDRRRRLPPPHTRPRRIARSRRDRSRSRPTGRRAARARDGTAATALRSRIRSSSRAARCSSSQTRRSRYEDWRVARRVRPADRRPRDRRFRHRVPPILRSTPGREVPTPSRARRPIA